MQVPFSRPASDSEPESENVMSKDNTKNGESGGVEPKEIVKEGLDLIRLHAQAHEIAASGEVIDGLYHNVKPDEKDQQTETVREFGFQKISLLNELRAKKLTKTVKAFEGLTVDSAVTSGLAVPPAVLHDAHRSRWAAKDALANAFREETASLDAEHLRRQQEADANGTNPLDTETSPKNKNAQLPPDLITLDVATSCFRVSRTTLKRAISQERIKSYRPCNAPWNAPHKVSAKEVAAIWTRLR